MMRRRMGGEDGFAMITAIMTGGALVAVALAASAVALDGVKRTRVDGSTGKSLGVAEAAVTRAQQYLKSPTGGPRALKCSPTCGVANPWGDQSAPMAITFSDQSKATAWIEVQQPFAPPAYLTGTYIIHAVGKTPDAQAARSIDETIALTTVSFPLGIYSDNRANFQGNGVLHQESLFSVSCIDQRGADHLAFDKTVVDAYYNIPPAAHTTSFISTDQNAAPACTFPPTSAPAANNMHAASPCNDTQWSSISWARYDQSGYGGDYPTTSACYTDPRRYSTSSLFTLQMLKIVYGYRPAGLTPEAYDYLRQVAKANNTWYTTTTGVVWPSASTVKHPVLYFDLATFGTVSVDAQLASYGWVDEAGGVCNADHPSVVIVVKNGNLSINGSISGAFFAPDGAMQVQESARITGTLFSKNFTSYGNGVIGLNACYASNTSPVLLDPKPVTYHQIDPAS